MRQQLRDGASLLDLMNLRDRLHTMGYGPGSTT